MQLSNNNISNNNNNNNNNNNSNNSLQQLHRKEELARTNKQLNCRQKGAFYSTESVKDLVFIPQTNRNSN